MIQIGISACLAGEEVRYDGSSKYFPDLYKRLSEHFILLPVCPEAGAGLGTPRPPVELFLNNSRLECRQVDNHEINPTDKLNRYFHEFFQSKQAFCGFVLKARSPSCGINDAVVFQESGKAYSDGLFVKQLKEKFPGLPLANEMLLDNKAQLLNFINAVHAYANVK